MMYMEEEWTDQQAVDDMTKALALMLDISVTDDPQKSFGPYNVPDTQAGVLHLLHGFVQLTNYLFENILAVNPEMTQRDLIQQITRVLLEWGDTHG